MMNEQQVAEKIEELFGDNVCDPEHSPIVFRYQVQLAVWMLQQANRESKDPI